MFMCMNISCFSVKTLGMALLDHTFKKTTWQEHAATWNQSKFKLMHSCKKKCKMAGCFALLHWHTPHTLSVFISCLQLCCCSTLPQEVYKCSTASLICNFRLSAHAHYNMLPFSSSASFDFNICARVGLRPYRVDVFIILRPYSVRYWHLVPYLGSLLCGCSVQTIHAQILLLFWNSLIIVIKW